MVNNILESISDEKLKRESEGGKFDSIDI